MTPHNNAAFSSRPKGSEDMATEVTKKSLVLNTPRSPEAPSPRNPTYICIRSTCATFLPLIVWVYLLSNFHTELRKTHHLCNRVRYGRSMLSKVVDVGTN